MKNAAAPKPIRQQKSQTPGDKIFLNSQVETQKSLAFDFKPSKSNSHSGTTWPGNPEQAKEFPYPHPQQH
jgi:hypothetical protein